MKYFITLLSVCFALWLSGFAQADDPFTVTGIPVDATGSTPIEAQTLAIRDGQARAANILLERLTIEGERLSKGTTPVSEDNAAKMIRAMEIDNEKRSSTRYLGDISVAFNPSAMQAYINQSGLTMVSSQSRDRLVLPLSNGQLNTSSIWFQAWEKSGSQHALTPVKPISVDQAASLPVSSEALAARNMNALKQVGAMFNVQQLLIADDLGGVVKVTDIALDSGNQQNFNVSGGPSAVISKLESDWKSAAVSVAANAVDMPVSVLYSSHRQWLRLKEAINGSAQIQDARLDALSKDGAVMTLTYGGDMGRLRNELAFKGVSLKEDPELGVVLSPSGRF
ncbi:hypothetical protein [Hellea balneolensis]|uniref:hypothetical protein n=1 Tax=Hellea balneolensis TaxID=287478 RepID=UPI00047A468B|nr:hypothetical protein [Hellea balneolensis]